MHYSVQAFVVERTTDETFNHVVELGSLDVNGGVRHIVKADRWIGVDLVNGPGVDHVGNAHNVGLPDHSADLVLCLEMLEHDSDPNATFATIARLLTHDGKALVTTRSEGFPLHHEPDYWRFTCIDIYALAYTAGLNVSAFQPDPQDGHPGVFAEVHL